MKNTKSNFLWVMIRSALISGACTGAIYYVAGGAKHLIPFVFGGFFAAFVFAEYSTKIFEKIAKFKGLKLIFSLLITGVTSIALAQASTHVAMIAAPFIFAFSFFGGFAILDKWLAASDDSLADLIKPAPPCEKCGKIHNTYNHSYRKTSEYVNTTTNPSYSSLPNNSFYHR